MNAPQTECRSLQRFAKKYAPESSANDGRTSEIRSIIRSTEYQRVLVKAYGKLDLPNMTVHEITSAINYDDEVTLNGDRPITEDMVRLFMRQHNLHYKAIGRGIKLYGTHKMRGKR